MKSFCKQVDAAKLSTEAVIHFGVLLGIENIFTVFVRCKNPAFIQYVADRFGADAEAEGLMPHEIRFISASKTDGHLIPRTFSLPIIARLFRGKLAPDPKGGIVSIAGDIAEGTSWNVG